MNRYLALLSAVMLAVWAAYAQDVPGPAISAPEVAGLMMAVAVASPAFGYLLVKKRK